VYYCCICACEKKWQDPPVLKGNSSALNHMISHGYDRDGSKIEKITKSIPDAAVSYTPVTATRYESFETLLVRWIVYCQVTFAMLIGSKMSISGNYSPASTSLSPILLPRARARLRKWIMDEYVTQKAVLKDDWHKQLATSSYLSISGRRQTI